MLNPKVDAETVVVWMHARPGSEILNRNVNAETLDVWTYARNSQTQGGAEMVDVWMHIWPGSEMPSRKVDTERCVFPQRDARRSIPQATTREAHQ